MLLKLVQLLELFFLNQFSLGILTQIVFFQCKFSLQSRSFESFEELVAYYESGKLHRADFKPALAKALNKILEVCSFHFHLSLINAS